LYNYCVLGCDTLWSGINLPPCIGRKVEAAGYSEAVCTRQHGFISQKRVHSAICHETICNLNIHSHENIVLIHFFSMPVVIIESVIRDFIMQNRV